jgi:hypothetical protein
MSNQSREKQLSQYNSAAQEVIRIDDLYKRIHAYRRNGNLKAWNYELDSLWEELGADKNVAPSDDAILMRFIVLYSKANKNNRPLIYQILIKKELFLRRLQNRIGKGSKYQKPDDSGMD